MNLPMQPQIERSLAHLHNLKPCGLLPAANACKGQPVMVAHGRARGASLIRYPSPAGRGGCPQGRRPCFFLATGGGQKGQGSSTKRPIVLSSLGVKAAKTAQNKCKRGKELCKRSQNGLQRSARRHCSLAAATPSLNKPSSAAARAQLCHMSPKVTCSPVPLSARYQTSLTVRNSRHAAKLTTTHFAASSGAQTQTKATSEHNRSGVAFSLLHWQSGTTAKANTKGTCHV